MGDPKKDTYNHFLTWMRIIVEIVTYYQSTKQVHVNVIKKSVRCLVQESLSNQARTRPERLLADYSSQYNKV